MSNTILYSRFERFWHWMQALLITLMLTTGFEIHGSYRWLGFETATDIHNLAAWCLIGLWLLVLFWHATTGQWRHYVPGKPESVRAMVRYYTADIFFGAAHPFHRRRMEKHNPLQRMAYLGLTLIVSPIIWISGLFYLFYAQWSAFGPAVLSLQTVALIHTLAAFAMLAFLIVHLYLTLTTSQRPFDYLREMITGVSRE